ncbi:MAG TPA: DUF2779 domain-containing protein [Spirochaetia bacterium]|nr:DUF2779 domain-containing protein [Spirochaetia bacterium]
MSSAGYDLSTSNRTDGCLITAESFAEAQKCVRHAWEIAHAGNESGSPYQVQYARSQYRNLMTLAIAAYGVAVDLGYGPELPDDVPGAHARTMEALGGGFGVSGCWFVHDDCAAYVPIIAPSGASRDLIFIHPAARAKSRHIQEAAFSYSCAVSCGISVNRVLLLSVNREFVRGQAIDPNSIFLVDDMTAVIPGIAATIMRRTETLRAALAQPVASIPSCDRAYSCPVCSQYLPPLPRHNVFTLYRGSELSRRLFREGITDLVDLAPGSRNAGGTALSERQLMQIESVRTGSPVINRNRLEPFLAALEYPLAFLDFETYSVALPPFQGLRPWQHVPFQFSLHVKRSREATPSHVSFIEPAGQDGREALLTQFLSSIPPTGSIVVFGSNFERAMLMALGDAFPQSSEAVRGAVDRVVDLSQPFQSFWYYHPEQRGKLSLKAILPALTGKSYSALAISDGLDASMRYYVSSHRSKDIDSPLSYDVVAQIRHDLEEYCGMDTQALVDILEVLERSVNG